MEELEGWHEVCWVEEKELVVTIGDGEGSGAHAVISGVSGLPMLGPGGEEWLELAGESEKC